MAPLRPLSGPNKPAAAKIPSLWRFPSATLTDPEALKKLRMAGIIYGTAAGIIFLVAAFLLIQGRWFACVITFMPCVVLAAMAWQCLRLLENPPKS